jgi:unsaturated rhamnogalacturonyl hydrolase
MSLKLIVNNIICKKNFSTLLLFLLGLFLQCLPATAQDNAETKDKLRLVANAVIKDVAFQFVDTKSGKHYKSAEDAPFDAILQQESAYTEWRYWNGVLNIAMMKLGGVLHEPAYAEFASTAIAFSFDNYRYFQERYKGEGKWNYPFGQFFIMEELDDCGAVGASVIELYRINKQERYKDYIGQAAKHILTKQSRLEDGTLVRSFPHKWTLWADDLYMSISFLARMGELTNDVKYFNDAAKQVIQFNKYLFNEQVGLMYHCWYSDINCQGVAFWGRANGWALLAQVDLLDRLPKNSPYRDTLLALLQRHIHGISRYQSSDGLWHQLLDKEDSYLETSCSAMFTYALARSINKRYIEPRYASIAKRGWQGVMSKIHADGQIEGVCAGTVVSDDLDDYYHRPTPLNDVHGVGAVLLAGAEIVQLKK